MEHFEGLLEASASTVMRTSMVLSTQYEGRPVQPQARRVPPRHRSRDRASPVRVGDAPRQPPARRPRLSYLAYSMSAMTSTVTSPV